MALTKTCFKYYSKRSDLDNTIGFLKELPRITGELYHQDYSNFFSVCLNQNGKDGITPKMIRDAHNEAIDILLDELDSLPRRTHRPFTKNKYLIEFQLDSIGFTGESLKIKAKNLNRLWTAIVGLAKKTKKKIIDFSNKKLVKLLGKFLTFLNSMLGSLTKVFPGVEALKEFKEIIESYLGVGEELGDE